ncbi:hypothetical protein [Maribacter sp. 2-571]
MKLQKLVFTLVATGMMVLGSSCTKSDIAEEDIIVDSIGTEEMDEDDT